MSFREKSDWLSFLSLWSFGIYFGEIALRVLGVTGPVVPYHYFIFFWVMVAALVVIRVVTLVILALREPKDAKSPVDERERLIHLRATQPAYFLLLVGTFLTIGTLHMGFNTWQFAHCTLFVIWIAELTRYGLRLYYYRRAL